MVIISVIMLSVVMISVVMKSVIMLSVEMVSVMVGVIMASRNGLCDKCRYAERRGTVDDVIKIN